MEVAGFNVTDLTSIVADGAVGVSRFLIDPTQNTYNLTWNAALETGGILVDDEVTITLDVQS